MPTFGAPGEGIVEMLKRWYRDSHQRILRTVEDLSDEQLAWKPTPTSHSLAFQLWHVARVTEHLFAQIANSSPAVREKLGFAMDDGTAGSIRLPAKEALLDYVRRVFARTDQAMDLVQPQEFLALYDASRILSPGGRCGSAGCIPGQFLSARPGRV